MIKKKIGSALRRFVTNTPWFTNQFLDCAKLWNQKEFDLDMVFLGSFAGHYSCSPSVAGCKADDWTLRDSTILQNYEVLRNYSSYLKEKQSTVIFIISPFDFLTGSTQYFEDRFYSILNMASIPGFAYERRAEVLARRNNPILYYPLFCLRKDIPALFKKKTAIDKTTAEAYLCHIKHRYAIRDFEAKLSMLNQDAFDDSVEIIKKMKAFSDEHNINLVLALPPVSKEMKDETKKLMENPSFKNMTTHLEEAGIAIKDFSFDSDFNKTDLFLTELYLNHKGAELFTQKVTK